MTEILKNYLDGLAAKHHQPFYIERRFRTVDEWLKWSSHDWRGHSYGHEPQLNAVLNNRRVLILGEPGAGKSTVAHAAVAFAISRGWVPAFVDLRSYDGDLHATIDRAMTPEVSNAVSADSSLSRMLILDGFDEIPTNRIEAFVNDFRNLEQEPQTRVLLTSRQAFYMNRRGLFTFPPTAFYLLDLENTDVDRFIANAEVERDRFRAAAAEAQLSFELANPFALTMFLRLFKDTGTLGTSKSHAVGYVVDATLQSNPTSDPQTDIQALRMLALAMETAAKNELTEDEAREVLVKTLHHEADEAKAFLDELSRSILIRTQNGYAFQMRSYGEYLAAKELADGTELERLLEPMFLGESREPQDSWRNAVSYLVEQSTAARKYFIRDYPDWLLTSSPTLFKPVQKNQIVRRIIKRLHENQEYLLHHPLIRAFHLGRFLTPETVAELRDSLLSEDDVTVANAVLALGAYGDRDSADAAFRLGLDSTRSIYIRHSALSALQRIGSPSMIPELLNIPDWNESSVTIRIDAASALMDDQHTKMVLQALGQTDTLMSAAFDRFRDLTTPQEIMAVVDGLLEMPEEAIRGRLHAYLDPVWTKLVELWNPDWAPRIAALLDHSTDDEGINDVSDKLAKALFTLPDRGAAVGQRLLQNALGEGRALRGFPRAVPQLISLDDVLGVVALGEPNAQEMLSYLRAFGAQDVREFLFSLRPANPQAEAEHEREVSAWQRKQKAAEAKQEHWRDAALKSEDAEAVVDALARLEEGQWPALPAERVALVKKGVDRILGQLDLPHRIVWTGDNSWTMPQVLPLLLKLVDHYEIKLADDMPLAESLRASEQDTVVKYFKRYGLSDAALARLEQVASDPATPVGALAGVLEFINRAPVHRPSMLPILEAVLVQSQSDRNRRTALQTLVATDEGRGIVAKHLGTLSDDLRITAELTLIEHQHRPTIWRRLNALLSDVSQLDAGNVEFPNETPLKWLSLIRVPETWSKFTTLRRIALERGLANTVGIISQTMAAIDAIKLAGVIRQQLEVTPDDWKPMQRVRAIEHERDGKMLAAQGAPFTKVLDRLVLYSSSNRYKFWVEGPTDVPAFAALLKIIPGGGRIRVQPFGGWATVLADQWTPRNYGDGCSLFSFMFDGDRAYDWSSAGRPLRRDVAKAIAKLKAHHVEYHILNRYALENYFPRSAYEKVLGVDLASKFPLDNERPVEAQGLPGYKKDLNASIAEATTLADLKGTDLGDSLQGAIEWVEDE
jgi:hypothetical protein